MTLSTMSSMQIIILLQTISNLKLFRNFTRLKNKYFIVKFTLFHYINKIIILGINSDFYKINQCLSLKI